MLYIATDNIAFRDNRAPIKRGQIITAEDFPGVAKCKAAKNIVFDEKLPLLHVPGWSRRASKLRDYDVESFLLEDTNALAETARVNPETITLWKNDLKTYVAQLFAPNC